jgi:hypothetical protein
MLREREFFTSNAVSFLTLLVSIIALILAWQANQTAQEANRIAEEQGSGQLVVLNSDTRIEIPGIRRGYDPSVVGAYITCINQIRLANLGGKRLTVTDFSTRLFYNAQEAVIETQSLGESWGAEVPTEHNLGIDDRIEVGLFTEEDFLNFYRGTVQGMDKWYSSGLLPLPIDSSEVVDVYLLIDVLFREEAATETAPAGANVSPFDAEFTFATESGEKATTPRITCAYVIRD